MVEECATCEAVYHRSSHGQIRPKIICSTNVGRGYKISLDLMYQPLQGLFPLCTNVPSVCTERGQTGGGAGTVKCDQLFRRAEGEEDKKV